MKHLVKGRNQRLAGKNKSNRPSTTKPSATRSRKLALRKKTKLDNQRKHECTLAKKAKAAAEKAATVAAA